MTRPLIAFVIGFWAFAYLYPIETLAFFTALAVITAIGAGVYERWPRWQAERRMPRAWRVR